jgi:hypothetical protein
MATFNPHKHSSWGNVTLTASNTASLTASNTVYTIGVGGGGSGGSYYNATSVNPWATAGTVLVGTNPSLQVSGDADIKGNLKVNGVDIGTMLAKIQDRLAILVPDPVRLDKYEALKQAYEHYKVLEALCIEETIPGVEK